MNIKAAEASKPARISLSELRLARGKSRMELASEAGVHLRTIINAERRRYRTKTEIAHRIAAALGVTINDILEFGPDE